jgi:hypothetical protein
MKAVVPRLVDTQQTGFVQGRNIQDNILTLRAVQEKAKHSKTPLAMLLLDFAKAYDQVDHSYTWAVLEIQGFDSTFINLIKGLVVPGSAKVHFNGLFTGRFPLDRGVRQGCPLAPLLFALVSQPLMAILKEKLNTGDIHGIQIGERKQLLYQLFADDTGIFFEATFHNFDQIMGCLHLFERISGALLNLDKCKLIQLD